MKQYMTAIIEKKGTGYVALCPDLDIASQGDTVSEAKENLLNECIVFSKVAKYRVFDVLGY